MNCPTLPAKEAINMEARPGGHCRMALPERMSFPVTEICRFRRKVRRHQRFERCSQIVKSGGGVAEQACTLQSTAGEMRTKIGISEHGSKRRC
jgi:hypothetical protein